MVPPVTDTGKAVLIAVSGAPSAAMMSKLVSTGVPLMDTLKIRWPGEVQ
jgi:hypothetical protein